MGQPDLEKPLRVGILCGGTSVDYYSYRIVEHLVNSDSFDPPVLITGYAKSQPATKRDQQFWSLAQSGKLFKALNLFIFNLLIRLIDKVETRKIARRNPNFRSHKDLEGFELQAVELDGSWSKAGSYVDFSKEDLQKIQAEDLDVILGCGDDIIRGAILDSAKFGVLSFHHGDNRVNRGGPAGFWEVLNATPSSGFIIQQLNSELNGGKVVFRGNITTEDFWYANQAKLREASLTYMIKVFDDLAKHRQLKFEKTASLYHEQLLKLDGRSSVLFKYLWNVYSGFLYRRLRRSITPKQYPVWSVAFSKFDGLHKSLFRYVEIENPRKRFLADPFVFSSDGENICFVEDYFFDEKKGKISAVKLNGDNYEFLGPVLDEEFHLSFPFVFRHDGEIYMIPETYQARQIRLYKCTDFPMKWEFEKVLIDDVNAADSMVIQHGSEWFLFSNICTSGLGEHNSELHIFYADNPLENNWKPLTCGNPIIFDSQRARNGGFFVHEGELYRVNQVQDINHYGRSFELNKVLELSVDSYAEIKVDSVFPNFKKNIISTHHFHTNGEYMVIDFMRSLAERDAW